MNEAAMKQHEILNKLANLSGQELVSVADFIDFLSYKKNQPTRKKIIKLQGILTGHNLDSTDLANFRQGSWKHLEEEFGDE